MWPVAGGDDYTQCSYNDEQDSIKQLAEIALRADRMEGMQASRGFAESSLSIKSLNDGKE